MAGAAIGGGAARGAANIGRPSRTPPEAEVHHRTLTEDTLRRIRRDDPAVAALSLPCDDSLVAEALVERYDEVRDALVRSSRLRSLRISHTRFLPPDARESLLAGLARNRSLEELALSSCHLEQEPIILDLEELRRAERIPDATLFENLRRVHVSCCRGAVDFLSLAGAFSSTRGRKPLSRIEISTSSLRDDEGACVVESLKRHPDLREISLRKNCIGFKSCVELAQLLAAPKSKLSGLDIGRNRNIDDDCIPFLANALATNRALKRLCFDGMKGITALGWSAFSTILYSPTSSLEELKLNSNGMTMQGAIALGNALKVNTTLKSIDLSSIRMHSAPGTLSWTRSWVRLLGFLSSPRSAVETIDVSDCEFNDKIMAVLGSNLATNTTIENLRMRDNGRVTPSSWKDFFGRVLGPSLPLEGLELDRNNIDDEAAAALVDELAGSGTLKSLHLGGLGSTSPVAACAFSTLLRRPGSSLTSLHLLDDADDELISHLASALVSNTALTELRLSGRRVTERGWDRMSRALCNAASVASTYASNHTLCRISSGAGSDALAGRGGGRRTLAALLRMNAHRDKSDVARRKILGCHFPTGDPRVFADMGARLWPRALRWTGGDRRGFSLLYRLVRCISPQLALGKRPRAVRGKRKRKRGRDDRFKLAKVVSPS